MPIKVSCQCGQTLTAKDSLAGKRVKCPKCGAPLTISRPQPKQPAADDSIGDLLDEAGMTTARSGHFCPSCNAEMPPDAVICVECGYNKNLGRRMGTQRG